MRTHTDDTRVDLRRSSASRVEAHSEATVPTAPPMFDVDDDDEQDKETLLCARLPWPEPPRALSERPRLSPRPTGRTLPTGLSRSIATPLGGHPAYWRGLAVAAIVGASAPMFLSRSPRTSPALATTSIQASAETAARPAPPENKLVPPPLVITVGTPQPSAPTRTPIDVTKLPIAPRVVASPAPPKRAAKAPARVKPTSAKSVPRASADPDSVAARGAVIDDGF